MLVQFVGLGPGSSSQYSMYWLRHMPVHWTRPVRNRLRLRRDPCPPPAGERGPPEAPPEGDLDSLLIDSRAKKYVVFGPSFKGNLVVD